MVAPRLPAPRRWSRAGEEGCCRRPALPRSLRPRGLLSAQARRFVPAALYPYTTHWVSTVKTPTRSQESPLDPPTPCSTRRSSQLPFLGSSTRTQSRERPCAIRVSDSELGSRIFYAQRHRRLPFCRDHRAQPRPQQARAMQGGAAFGNATGTFESGRPAASLAVTK